MDEKYFKPGDLVMLNKKIPNSPVMIVVRKECNMFHNVDEKENTLRGIRCRWFTTDGLLQEAVWNTKDLIKVETK